LTSPTGPHMQLQVPGGLTPRPQASPSLRGGLCATWHPNRPAPMVAAQQWGGAATPTPPMGSATPRAAAVAPPVAAVAAAPVVAAAGVVPCCPVSPRSTVGCGMTAVSSSQAVPQAAQVSAGKPQSHSWVPPPLARAASPLMQRGGGSGAAFVAAEPQRTASAASVDLGLVTGVASSGPLVASLLASAGTMPSPRLAPSSAAGSVDFSAAATPGGLPVQRQWSRPGQAQVGTAVPTNLSTAVRVMGNAVVVAAPHGGSLSMSARSIAR